MDRETALRLADQAMGLTRAPRLRPLQAAPASIAADHPPTVAASVRTETIASPVRTSTPSVAGAASTLRSVLPRNAQVHSVADEAEAARALEALRSRHDAECPHCTTAGHHTRTVFGEGHARARLMFVGEAPGEMEDRTGRPFVGPAGEKLDGMIAAMGLRREEVYIANVLKSRPPENRTPLQHEVDACGPYLIEQILLVRPEVLITLGGPATKLLLGTETGISRLRGVWAAWQPPAGHGDSIPVMPTYHPAYLLRNYTVKTRAEVWSDLQAAMARLRLAPRAGG